MRSLWLQVPVEQTETIEAIHRRAILNIRALLGGVTVQYVIY